MYRSAPISSASEGMAFIDSFAGLPEDFELAVPHGLLDPIGITVAMLTDRALARDWEPDGFTDEGGCRIFRYKFHVPPEEAEPRE